MEAPPLRHGWWKVEKSVLAANYGFLVGLEVGGKYELVRVLGAGGMGVVCEAVHREIGKRVAVKLIDRAIRDGEGVVGRFRREARAAGPIDSEHIVDVFDVGADPRVGLYIVMEMLVGEDLQARLERARHLGVHEAIVVGDQVARALAKAHEAGVVHRDLKPANVFLTQRDDGQMLVKLLDFGVSKLLWDDGSALVTASGVPVGTPLYMSPEQAEGRTDVDARADIWSLGALLYEALAGRPPFPDRGGYHATIVGILTSRPALLHDAAPWVPDPIARVVDAMLVHDRDARIPDARTVCRRLADASSALPSAGAEARRGAFDVEHHYARHGVLGAAPRDDDPATMPTERDVTRALEGSTDPDSARVTAAPTAVTLAPRRALELPDASAEEPARSRRSDETGELHASEAVPDTARDAALALRAERRRWLTLGGIAASIVGVATGGYVAGRHASNRTPTAAPLTPVPPPHPPEPRREPLSPIAAPRSAPSADAAADAEAPSDDDRP